MTTNELEELRNLFHLYNNNVIGVFRMGVSIASLYARRQISKDSFDKISDYFEMEAKHTLPKETTDFINLFSDA